MRGEEFLATQEWGNIHPEKEFEISLEMVKEVTRSKRDLELMLVLKETYLPTKITLREVRHAVA